MIIPAFLENACKVPQKNPRTCLDIAASFMFPCIFYVAVFTLEADAEFELFNL